MKAGKQPTKTLAFTAQIAKINFIFLCGGLTLAGRQVPTKAAVTPLLRSTGERKFNVRLVGRGKNRERSLTN